MEPLHAWNLSPDEAVRVQAALRERLVLEWDGRVVNAVAGVDMSLAGEKAHAAIVVLRYSDLQPLAGVTADAPLVFPYIPGLLAFREGPAVLAAWDKLSTKPDVVMFDGQGIAHPRSMGIAAHMGLWLQRPTIGVAKSRLYGHNREPGPEPGDITDLHDNRDHSRIIGAVLRTRARSKPLYISPGHLIDLPHALEFVRHCLAGYRLPETTRWAHKFAAGEPLPLAADSQRRLF
ncbi:MAG: deoxyribonuclease V [Anaerolineales bacterium]